MTITKGGAKRPATATETPVAAWQSRLGLTDRAAAAALGMTLAGYQRNKRGRSPGGAPRGSSATVLLACAAVEAGLPPLPKTEKR